MTPSIATFAERHKRLSAAIRQGTVRDVSKIISHYAGVLKDSGGIPTSLALSNPASAQVDQIDDRLKAIPFIVTVLQEDRDGDVVIPKGISVENYVNNAVVFFGHQEWVVPIGSAKNPRTKRLAWSATENEARSICYFDHADPDAMFIYGKVQRGFLSATSIAFVPVEAYKRDDYDKAYRGEKDSMMPVGWLFKKVDLTEWSIVGVPSNAGAIRDALDSEKSFITPRLQKALVPYAAQPRGRCFSGWCPVPAKAIARTPIQKAVVKDAESNPYQDQGCPICGKHAVGSCRCKGPHSLDDLKNGHGLKCPNGHRFSRDSQLVFDPASQKGATSVTTKALPFWSDLKKTVAKGDAALLAAIERDGKKLVERANPSYYSFEDRDRAERYKPAVDLARSLYAAARSGDMEEVLRIYRSFPISDGLMNTRLVLIQSGVLKGRKSLPVTKAAEVSVEIKPHPTSPDHRLVIVHTRTRDYFATWAEPFPSEDRVRQEWVTNRNIFQPYNAGSKSLPVTKELCPNNGRMTLSDDYGCPAAFDSMRKGKASCEGCGKSLDLIPFKLKGKSKMVLQSTTISKLAQRRKGSVFDWMGTIDGKRAGFVVAGDDIRAWVGPNQFRGKVVWNQLKINWEYPLPDTPDRYLLEHEVFTNAKSKAKKAPCSCSGSCGGKGSCSNGKSLNSTSGTSGGYLVQEQEDEDMTTKRKPAKKTMTRKSYESSLAALTASVKDKVRELKRDKVTGMSVANLRQIVSTRGVDVPPGSFDQLLQEAIQAAGASSFFKGGKKAVRKDNAEEMAQEEATEHGADMDVVETAMEENPEVFAGDETPEEEAAEEAAIEAVKAPHSAYALAMSHQHLKALKDYIAAEDEVFEPDSGVRKYLKEKLEPDLDHHMEKMGEMFGARYPNQEMSKLCGGPSEDKAEIEEEDVVTKGRRLKSDLFGAKCPNCGNKVTESGDQVFCPKCDWIGSIDQTKGRRKAVRKNMILSIYVPPEKVNSIRSRIEGSGGKVRINGNEGGLTKLTMEGDDRQIGWAVSEDEGPRRNRPFKPFEDSKDGETDYLEEKDELDAMDGAVEMEEDEEVEKGEFEEEEIITSDDLNGTEDADHMTEEEADEIVDESTEEILERYAAETDYKGKGRRKMAVRKSFSEGEAVVVTTLSGDRKEGTIAAVYQGQTRPYYVNFSDGSSGTYREQDVQKKSFRKSRLSLKNLSGRWFVKQVTKDGEELHGPYDTVDEATEVKAEMETEEEKGQTVEVRILPALASPGKFMVGSVRSGHLANDAHEGMLFNSEAEARQWAISQGYTPVKSLSRRRTKGGFDQRKSFVIVNPTNGYYITGSRDNPTYGSTSSSAAITFNTREEAERFRQSYLQPKYSEVVERSYAPRRKETQMEYRTPFGTFQTWEEAARRVEQTDMDPTAVIEIVRKDDEEIEIEEKDGDEIVDEVEMEDDDPVEKDALEDDDEEVVEMAVKGKRRQAKSAVASFDDWISRVEALAFRTTGVKLN